jgi:hypothetical protein
MAGLNTAMRLPPGGRVRVVTVVSRYPLDYASYAGTSTSDTFISGTSVFGVQFSIRPRYYIAAPDTTG